jgi:hypothetical protein
LFDSAGVLLPGLAGKRNLEPLYEKATKAIRAKDSETIIFWEPVTWAYIVPSPTDPILDPFLVSIFDGLNLKALSGLLEELCGELEPMVAEEWAQKSKGMQPRNFQNSFL